MQDITSLNLDYDRPIKIADDTYWVGAYDEEQGCHSNPYVIVDNDEAILIDGGSRSDFPTVMMKIMEIGITPSTIVGLIYQNYTPRLCGSLPHLEMIVNRRDVKIISDKANHMFIQHYSETANLYSIEDLNYEFTFSSGRSLHFIKTPFAHSAGSLVTFDRKTNILFTGDLFSSYSSRLNLLLKLKSRCRTCREYTDCPENETYCAIYDILKFHRDIMASERALRFALESIASVPFKTIAPQHGSIIYDAEDIIVLCELLASLKGVGIDGVIGDRSFHELGDTEPIKQRLIKSERQRPPTTGQEINI